MKNNSDYIKNEQRKGRLDPGNGKYRSRLKTR